MLPKINILIFIQTTRCHLVAMFMVMKYANTQSYKFLISLMFLYLLVFSFIALLIIRLLSPNDFCVYRVCTGFTQNQLMIQKERRVITCTLKPVESIASEEEWRVNRSIGWWWRPRNVTPGHPQSILLLELCQLTTGHHHHRWDTC